MNGTPIKVTIHEPRRRRRYRSEADLTKAVPARLRPYLEAASHDNDGYWFYFDQSRVEGGACGSAIVHEDTLRDAKTAMADMVIREK